MRNRKFPLHVESLESIISLSQVTGLKPTPAYGPAPFGPKNPNYPLIVPIKPPIEGLQPGELSEPTPLEPTPNPTANPVGSFPELNPTTLLS